MPFRRSLAIICLQERYCCSAFPLSLIESPGCSNSYHAYQKLGQANISSFIRKKFPSFKVTYKKNIAYKKACLQEKFSQKKILLTSQIQIFPMLAEETLSPIAYVTVWACKPSGFFLLIFLVSSPSQTTAFRFQILNLKYHISSQYHQVLPHQ